MSAFFASIGLPQIVAAVMLVALNAYVLTGGADFGGGVWDLLASGSRRDAQRTLVSHAIGPIWEANHVWLIVVIVVLFTAFPPVFATLGTVLHIPLSLMLVGIVLRGSAFVFRSYGARDDATQRRWGRVFAIASVITPLLLGVIVGAIVSGRVGRAAALLPANGGASTADFSTVYMASWLAAFPLMLGVMTLALFAFLAAVYLTVAAADAALREDFRRRALVAGVAALAASFGALALAHREAPWLSWALTETPIAALLQLVVALVALLALAALWTRRWRLARLAAALQVSLILWGWVPLQYPWMLPPLYTTHEAAAPRITLELLLWGLAGGSAILIPSLIYLFRTFAKSAAVR
ncbi:MAG TPA: cytochrome d ubiquinol oxidase subunit II [Gemmatimonadaceae bacterium]|nr:cytochrome d ubiquinol oxidase subunit II [Gemmatimonadaceae bacterium]